MFSSIGDRLPGTKGYPTPESAAEVLRDDVNKGRTRKLTTPPQRVDTGDPDAVRLLYADASGTLVLQIEARREALGWFADGATGCGRES
jgi:hypothetical protein